jgi:hypothetical protein
MVSLSLLHLSLITVPGRHCILLALRLPTGHDVAPMPVATHPEIHWHATSLHVLGEAAMGFHRSNAAPAFGRRRAMRHLGNHGL